MPARTPSVRCLALLFPVFSLTTLAACREPDDSATSNVAPTATITAPADGAAGMAGAPLSLRGTVSDDNDASSTLSARWLVNGVAACAAATPADDGSTNCDVTVPEGDALSIRLEVVDPQDESGSDTVTLSVTPNATPDCAITAPADGSSDAEGATVIFRGTAADADVPADPLAVTWVSDRDGVIGTSVPTSDGSITFPYAGLSVNTHVVTMQVEDEVGAMCTAEILYSVGSPPTIDLGAPALDEVVNEGENITFSATVADNEDSAADLWVTWESDVDGVLHEGPPDSTGVAQFVDSGLSRGPRALTVTVTDSDGFYATQLGAFTVNGVPTAPTISLSPSSPDSADDLRVSIDAASEDPDGDPLTTTYTWSLNGVVSGASTTSTLPAASTSRGDTWSIAVVASDGYGDSPAGTDSVTIANTAPTLTSVALAPDPAYEEDVLTCTAGATSDADGDAVGLSYEWYVNGAAIGFDSDSLDSGSFDRGDSVYCTATPTDGTDDGATRSSSTLTIENSAPSIAAVSISPGTPKASSTLTCSYSGYADIDGDADQSTYAWTLDGVVVGTGSTLSGAFVGNDVVTCAVTPDDGADVGTAVSNSVTIANTAPVMGTVSISPSTAYNDDLLTCSASATDADGGSPSLSYAWTNTSTGAALGSGATLSLTSALVSSRESVTCAATATDSGTGTTTGAATVTLGNRSPVVTASLTPTSPTRTSTLSCAATTTDADNDTPALTFSWTVDGEPVAASSTSALATSLSGSFVAGQSVRCTVAANDGKTGSDSDAVSVTVANTAPTVAVTLSPSSVYTNDTLIAAATAADADGDSLTIGYDWYVDGSLRQSGPSSSLSGITYFNKGQTVYVTATADDGTVQTATTSSTVTVANSAPTSPVVSVTPADAYSGEDLTCSLTTASTDADGDTVSYAFAWDVDGVDYPGATDSATDSVVDGADVGSGETWTCEVAAGDGTATGSAATDAVTPVAGGVVEGDYTIENSVDVALLDGVTEITGTLTIADTGVSGLTSIVLPDLVSIGDLNVTGVWALERLELPALRVVGADFRIEANYALEDVLAPNLESIGGYFLVSYNYMLQSVDGAGGADVVMVRVNPALNELVGFSGSVGYVLIDYNDSLTTISGFNDAEHMGEILIGPDPSLTTLSGFSNLKSAVAIQVVGTGLACLDAAVYSRFVSSGAIFYTDIGACPP
jgi:hypothetical protein